MMHHVLHNIEVNKLNFYLADAPKIERRLLIGLSVVESTFIICNCDKVPCCSEAFLFIISPLCPFQGEDKMKSLLPHVHPDNALSPQLRVNRGELSRRV